MRKLRPILFILTMTLFVGTVLAGNTSASTAISKGQAGKQQVKFTSYKLANGLRLLLAPERSEAGVAINLTFDVGARNERPGHTGLANLLEHIMLQALQAATKSVSASASGETGNLFEGTINQERTSYYASFPANRLDAVLSSLAQHLLRAPDINQSTLDTQRAVIVEERKQAASKPYSAMDETLVDLSYSNFAYRHSSTGAASDLNNLTLDMVRSFFKTYYVPNNAVLSIAGNFDERETKKIVENYFKVIPRQTAPPRVDISQERSTSERRKTISDPLAKFPYYFTAYLTVPSDHPDWYALNLLADILGQGDTARLHLALVKKGLASSVPEGVNESRAPGLFRMGAKLPSGGNVEMVEAIIDAEVARIQSAGVTEDEMEKARAQERQYSLDQLRSASGKANFLSRVAVYYSDPERINNELSRLLAVSREDVQRVARKYLVRTNRAVVIVQPAALR